MSFAHFETSQSASLSESSYPVCPKSNSITIWGNLIQLFCFSHIDDLGTSINLELFLSKAVPQSKSCQQSACIHANRIIVQNLQILWLSMIHIDLAFRIGPTNVQESKSCQQKACRHAPRIIVRVLTMHLVHTEAFANPPNVPRIILSEAFRIILHSLWSRNKGNFGLVLIMFTIKYM